MGKSLLIGSVYLPNSFLMLLSFVGEGDELPDQQIDIQNLYMLAEIAERMSASNASFLSAYPIKIVSRLSFNAHTTWW